MSNTLDILLADQRKLDQRKAPPPVLITRADRIIAEGDARRTSYRRLNPSADAAMVYGAQISYLHAQVRMLDAEAETLNVVRDSALDYVAIDSIDISRQLIVGYAYQPETWGEGGCSEELDIQEVWVNGCDVAGILSDSVKASIHAAVLVKVDLLQAKGREQDGPQ